MLGEMVSYIIAPFDDLLHGQDVFNHIEKHSKRVLLPPVSFHCTRETVTHVEYSDRRESKDVDGTHAMNVLNKLQEVEGSAMGENAPLVLSTMENLAYCLLKSETCQQHAMSYSQCLASLQRILDEMYDFGPVHCSNLKAYAFGSTVCGMQNMGSDLDICIDGKIDSAPKNTWEDSKHSNTLSCVVRFSKQKFLHELADRLILRKVADESTLERVIHARIPVFNYVDRETGIKCDIIVGGETFRFKATVLALLGSIDWRFLALVRLVKLWASHHQLLDASLGMLNSYSLKLLVLFHLQNRPVPVLPTLCIGLGTPRPIQNGVECIESRDESRQRMYLYIEEFTGKCVDFQSAREKHPESWNKESISELFVSFMKFLSDVTSIQELVGDVTLMQRLKLDTWEGTFSYSQQNDTERAYHLYVRDPFESKPDNAARSLSLAGEREIQYQSALFSEAFDHACDKAVPSFEDISSLFSKAFGKESTMRAKVSYQESAHQPLDLACISENVDDVASVDCLLDSGRIKHILALLKKSDCIRY